MELYNGIFKVENLIKFINANSKKTNHEIELCVIIM